MMTEDEILAARTASGGWTRETLERWGVPWPPPKGWKAALIAADSFQPLSGPPQPAHGYTRNVAPRGPIVRQEDAFPESCCEGSAMEGKGDPDTP